MTPFPVAVDHYSYTYTAAGNVASRVNGLNSALSETYTYDGLNQLTSTYRNGSPYQGWTLDQQGNWTQFVNGTATQTRSTNDVNEITGITDTSDPNNPVAQAAPAYDLAGNMISNGTNNYTYDAWNRLAQVSDSSENVIATYAYDGTGQRIAKTVGTGESAVTTNYFYSGPQTIEEDQGGNPTVQYVYGVNANTPICRIAPSGSGTQVLYYTSDANNNVTALVDGATGDVVERYVYTAYGQTTVYSPGWVSTESSASTYGNEITYASYRFNPDSGLFYVNARYYDPALGTWAQRDPAGYIDGMSLYPYVQSNPTTYTDPTGLCTIAPPRTPVGTQRK